MIVWLASYPKSGNTFVRSLLSSYIFSEDGNFNFELLTNIKQFPDNSLFKQLGVDTNNDEEMYKNYINSQKIFNEKDSIRFLKTHSCFVNTNKFKFTDRHNTLGVIYIVRDPRNIITSFSHHFQITPEQAFENLLSHQYLGKTSKKHCVTYLGPWKQHFNSWKVFRRFNKYLLVRYEDLVHDTEKTFLNILKFIAHLTRVRFTYDNKKFKNTLETTSFERLQKLEAQESFAEAKENNQGEKIKFFNMGISNDWKKLLDQEIKEKLERELGDEMRELNYL